MPNLLGQPEKKDTLKKLFIKNLNELIPDEFMERVLKVKRI